MRIVIVGAGAVGSYLADRLAAEDQDVVVVEADEGLARHLQDQLDALVVHGNGASRETLVEAGVAEADLLVAVTSNDGVNVLACHAGRELGVPRTVARIEDQSLRPGLESLGVDVIIDPSETVARELLALLTRSGATDAIDFAGGKLLLLGDIVQDNSPMIGRDLAELRAAEADWEWSAAILRDGAMVAARGTTVVRERDHVLLMTQRKDADRALKLLGLRRGQIDRLMVVGGTRLAELAMDAARDAGFDVLAIEPDAARARALAEHHPKALVIHGDPTDPAVLTDQRLDGRDALAALSGWDETNLTSAILAKSLGAGVVLARFHRVSYVKLLIGSGIDAGVSPRLAAANAILQYVRRGRIHSVATFKDSTAEALEIEVSPDCEACGTTLADLQLPERAVVAGIVRDGAAFVPSGTTELRAGDHLITITPRDDIAAVEAMCAA